MYQVTISYVPTTLADFQAALASLLAMTTPAVVGVKPPKGEHGPNVTEYLRLTQGQRWKRNAAEYAANLNDETAAGARIAQLPPEIRDAPDTPPAVEGADFGEGEDALG